MINVRGRSLRESMHEGHKWLGRASHGGPRKDGTIIEVGLGLVLWNRTRVTDGAVSEAKDRMYTR